jgi:hypothetical protein
MPWEKISFFKHFLYLTLPFVSPEFITGGDSVATRGSMPTIKLGLRTIRALPIVAKATVFYDADLTGFGLKILPSGARSWIVEYRPGAGGRGVPKRRMVIGSPKTLTPEQARNRAAGILAEVRLGGDPAAARAEVRAAESVRDLMAAFMANHVRPKRKARTAKLFDGYVKNHIAPALGAKRRPASPAPTSNASTNRSGRPPQLRPTGFSL